MCGLGLGLRVLSRLLRILARLLRVLAWCGVLTLLWVLAALGLGLLAVVHDNECTDATDDDDCQDQQEDPLRAGRGGRRGGIRR